MAVTRHSAKFSCRIVPAAYQKVGICNRICRDAPEKIAKMAKSWKILADNFCRPTGGRL